MKAGDAKEQENNQQINGLQQKSEMTQTAFEGESEAGKAEIAEKETKEDRKFAEETGKEVDDANEAEKAKVAAGNEAHGEKEAGETDAAGLEAKQKKESTGDTSESEKGEASKANQKEKIVKDSSQPVSESVSEAKDDVSGKPEDLQREEGEKADVLKKNAKEEGQSGSTSVEPLSPEPEEEEEEFWPEFPPRSPEASPQSPTELKGLETGGITPPTTAPEAAPAEITSPEAALKGEKEAPSAAPEEAAATKEKKKRPAFDRREITRPRIPPRGQSRKAIVEKFGGAATGPAPNIKRTGGANTVKTMLLEWCRAMTRGYEHVDIQNFSTSWKSGMAFCALIHKFFPDAFDYANLDPTNRKDNFTLAFSTAEKYADCAQLLEVDDMVRMSVPDNKCIYTYVQELYRSLVEKGLVKTKKK
ncbi:smoothelin-like protein 1 isoform X1 [Pseudonaja textilis]|uniref:Smoothelin like 1 n=1 Tax=Pseudonaja textilis TaxID=8673 RepID=A0A670YYB3_PSETE|nr:smoothelin-like protein 1 isoform X1 [Pseudonaja textilis]XP_026575483.1 smoothelin-like protein 1 isoform X1 [Pseudonaja textilis]XP_026575484.1 smoothelin-like protein 1 isoform X1 [Pseudonaja textilis]XP_026575485.1 smoothelin-like protein 1 isoform X1 [Pseudonaja textilis]